MNGSARRLILALRQLNSELSTSNRSIAAQTGLNPADLAILDVVHREGPQSATSLARRTVTHLATMTGVLDRASATIRNLNGAARTAMA